MFSQLDIIKHTNKVFHLMRIWTLFFFFFQLTILISCSASISYDVEYRLIPVV